MIDRRTLLAGSVAALASTAVPTLARAKAAKPFFARHALPLGVQLYAIAPDLDADFDGTLAKLRTMGIRSVEMAGFHGRTAAQIRSAFDRAGLSCNSAHIQARGNGNGPSLDGDLDALARDMHTIGITQVVLPIPVLPTAPTSSDDFIRAASTLTPEAWKLTAQLLNDRGRALRQRGLTMSYHNHNFEFAPHPSGTAMDMLLRETDPDLVTFELDAGWVAAAGVDPVALLRGHPRRFTQMHVKDIKASTAKNFALKQDPVEVGAGKMDWPAILSAAYTTGVRQFYIEQEPPYTGPRLVSVGKSAAYLLALKTA